MEGLSEGVSGSYLESKGTGIYDVGLTISQDISDTNHWVTGLRTLLCALVESLFNRRSIFVGDVLTFSLINKLASKICIFARSAIFIHRLYVSNDSSELASTTRLFLVKKVEIRLL